MTAPELRPTSTSEQATHAAAEMPAAVPVFPDPGLVAKTMDAVFNKLKAEPVITRLQELGYTAQYAQKACLLYCAKVARPVLETSSLLNWLSFEAKPQDIEKPVTLHDLLEHLDIEVAVQKLLHISPDVSPDTAKLAVTLCLGDIAAAEKLLTTSNDVPAASPGTTQLEKYLLSVKQNWALPQGVTLPPMAPHTPEARSGPGVDSAQMQAAAALMMSAASTSAPTPAPPTPTPVPVPAPPSASPSSPPAPPATPTLTISSPSPATCSPSRSHRATVYSGRKRSSSCNSSSASSLSSSYPGSPFSSSSGGSASSVFATPPPSSSSAAPHPPPSASAAPLNAHSPFSTPSAGVGQGATLAQQLSNCTEPGGWELEKQTLVVQLADLQRHKAWADSRIRDLIRKACEVEKPLAEDNRALRDDLAKGEQERTALTARVRQLEANVARLKEGCFQEAAVRREVERKMAEAKAEAQASLLREGELQAQLADLQAQVKNLKRGLSAADRQRQKLVEEKAEVEERLEARDGQLAELQQRLATAEKLAVERASKLETGEKERSGALAYAHAQAAAWESAYRKSQEEATQKAQDLQLAQARIETLQQETVRQRAEVRSVQSELLQAQARLKDAESRSGSRLFMDGHWSAPDFLGQCGMLGGGVGGSGGGWREGTRSPSSAGGGDTSPDAGRVVELERKVAALRTELELERSAPSRCQQRDDRDVHQLGGGLLHHSSRLLDDRYKLHHPLHSLPTAQCT